MSKVNKKENRKNILKFENNKTNHNILLILPRRRKKDF